MRFYQLLFPDFVPTETQASAGDFRVAAEGELNNTRFGDLYAVNRNGLKQQASSDYNSPFKNLLEGGPCQTAQTSQNVYLAGVFDIDRDGPDLTLVVYPKYSNKIRGQNIRSVMASNGILSNVDILFQTHPANGNQIKDVNGNTTPYGAKAQKLFTSGTQDGVNQAWDLLFRYDSTPPTTPSLGFTPGDRARFLNSYGKTAPMLQNILKTLYSQNYFAPQNVNSDGRPGGVYVFSVDLDKSTANLQATTLPGESVRLKIQVKNEVIELHLYKEQKSGNQAHWRAVCGQFKK